MIFFILYLTLNSLCVYLPKANAVQRVNSWTKCGKRVAKTPRMLCCCCLGFFFCYYLLLCSLFPLLAFYYSANKWYLLVFNYFVNFYFEHIPPIRYEFWIDLQHELRRLRLTDDRVQWFYLFHTDTHTYWWMLACVWYDWNIIIYIFFLL